MKTLNCNGMTIDSVILATGAEAGTLNVIVGFTERIAGCNRHNSASVKFEDNEKDMAMAEFFRVRALKIAQHEAFLAKLKEKQKQEASHGEVHHQSETRPGEIRERSLAY